MFRHATAALVLLTLPAFAAQPDSWADTPPSIDIVVGPPWISIESPANPYNSETRGALLVVRVYHHGEAAFFPVSGTAEGLVDGKRQSSKLSFGSTSTPGMYTLKYAKPESGTWLLMIHAGEEGQHGQATAVVSLGADGQVASVQVPTKKDGDYTLPRELSEAEVTARLKGMPGA
ncbi:MAG TPA: hypothetical protein VJN95_16585 [Gemmatimonadales bacterium]|nr:hypothetical protein [Gemmatimonadales bacterium]